MKSFLFRLLCLMLGGLLPLLMAELFLRGAYAGHFSALIEDGELGQVLRPGLDGRKTYGGYERIVLIRTNSMGLRGPEVAPKSKRGVTRILALGDSFTFGDAVEQEEAWPYQLQKQLNEGTGSVLYEVINAGVSGYGTAQELLLYRRLEGRIHPDLVVAGFSVVNDLLDNLCVDERSYGPKTLAPCFTSEASQLRVQPPQPSGNHRDGSARSWIEHSRVAALVAGQTKRLLLWNPRILMLFEHVGIKLKLPYIPATVVSWYDSGLSEPGWALTRRLLLELRRTLARRGIRLVILIIPSSLQVEEGKRGVLRLLGQDDKRIRAYLGDPARPQRLIREFCTQVGLDCLDVLPTLQEAQARSQQLYYPIDQHLTPVGHRIVASLLAQHLLDLRPDEPVHPAASLYPNRR